MQEIQLYMHEIEFTINSNISAREAAQIMSNNSISSILVKDGDEYIGIITQTDMSEKVVALGLDPNATKVASIMGSPLITLDASLPMNEALLLMKRHHIRNIVATTKGKVVGTLSILDFARYHSQRIGDPISEFWGNSEVLLDDKTFEYALNKLLSAMAEKLGDTSQTGKAITNKSSLSKITQYATAEGLKDFAEILKLSTAEI